MICVNYKSRPHFEIYFSVSCCWLHCNTTVSMLADNTGPIVVKVSNLRRTKCNWFHDWILQIIAPWMWVNMELNSSVITPTGTRRNDNVIMTSKQAFSKQSKYAAHYYMDVSSTLIGRSWRKENHELAVFNKSTNLALGVRFANRKSANKSSKRQCMSWGMIWIIRYILIPS